MANLLGASKAVIPAFALMVGMLTLGVIPAQGMSASSDSVKVQVVGHYKSSASGGALHG